MTDVRDNSPAAETDRLPAVWPRFSAAVRGPELTARIGRLLAVAFLLCFVTGLWSHYQYEPTAFAVPASPRWGYRITQGVHVVTGIALIPLVLAKLWSVYPRLFSWPLVKDWKHGLERLSIAVLVSTVLVQLVTGFLNILVWYPWPWNFVPVHYFLSFVIVGSILLHLAIKWPVIRAALSRRLPGPAEGPGTVAADTGSLTRRPLPAFVPAVREGGLTRRGAFLAVLGGVGATVLTTVGQTLSPLGSLAVLAPRQPSAGPSGVPINRTAAQAKVTESAQASDWRLTVNGPGGQVVLDEAALLQRATVERSYPIACVEGWSASADWRGVRLLDLVREVGGDANSTVEFKSLQEDGPFRVSSAQGPQVSEALLATHLHGERLALDHGYPVRLIAPNRPGVLNTKWLSEVTVS